MTAPDTGYHFVSWSDGYPTRRHERDGRRQHFATYTATPNFVAAANVTYAPTAPWSPSYRTRLSDGIRPARTAERDRRCATFAINTYTLTYTAGANGTIVGTSPQTVDYGANGTLVTATPDTGYHFVSWSDGYPTAARTDMNVMADVNATATFAINNTYTLTYTAGPNGSISGTSPQMVNARRQWHASDGSSRRGLPFR